MGRLKNAWVCVVLAGAGVAGAGRALGARHVALHSRVCRQRVA
jgi:hypothetical protein